MYCSKRRMICLSLSSFILMYDFCNKEDAHYNGVVVHLAVFFSSSSTKLNSINERNGFVTKLFSSKYLLCGVIIIYTCNKIPIETILLLLFSSLIIIITGPTQYLHFFRFIFRSKLRHSAYNIHSLHSQKKNSET